MSLRPGDELAGFRIEGIAGRGGMGVVHRATQLGLDRPVALKVIAEALAADDAFRERFVRESRAAASIDHPNVTPIYSAGEERGVLYLAMRYVEGPDLRTLVRAGGPLEPARAAHVVAQVAAALDAAHERGIVHRDVKPANVLLGAGDHVYLTDFGLTKRIGSHTGSTRGGGWVGTLGYVAPEQIRNERVDARADVYALGCVLFHALTARPPYAAETDEALLYAHLSEPPPRASDLGAPAAFDAVVARALAKDPADRFPSAGDLGRAALAAAGHGAPAPERTVARGAAAPAGAEAGVTAVPGAPPPADDATAVTRRAGPGRRRPAWAWALAALPVAALAAVAALAVGGEDAPPVPTIAPPTATGTTADPGAPLTADRAFDVNGRPNAVLFTAGRLWVLRGGVPRVALVQGGSLRAGPVVGREPTALASGFGRVWVTNAKPATLTALDARTARTAGAALALGVPGFAVDVAAGQGAVWVGVRGRPGYVVKVDPRTRRVAKAIPVPEGVQNIAVGYGAVWVSARRRDVVVRIGVRDAAEQRIDVQGSPRSLATGADGVWVATGDRALTRIDPGSRTTETIRVGDEPYGVAVAERRVYVTNRLADSVTVVDARSRDPVAEVGTGTNPFTIDAAGRSVYVASPPDRTVYRLRPP